MEEKIEQTLHKLDGINAEEMEFSARVEGRLTGLDSFIRTFDDKFRTKFCLIDVMAKMEDDTLTQDLDDLLAIQEKRYPVERETDSIPLDNLISSMPYLREKMWEEYESEHGSFNTKVVDVLAELGERYEQKRKENLGNNTKILEEKQLENNNKNKQLEPKDIVTDEELLFLRIPPEVYNSKSNTLKNLYSKAIHMGTELFNYGRLHNWDVVTSVMDFTIALLTVLVLNILFAPIEKISDCFVFVNVCLCLLWVGYFGWKCRRALRKLLGFFRKWR